MAFMQSEPLIFQAYSRDLENGLVQDGYLTVAKSYSFSEIVFAVRQAVCVRKMFETANPSLICFDRKYEDLCRVKYVWDYDLGRCLYEKHLRWETSEMLISAEIASTVYPYYSRTSSDCPRWYDSDVEPYIKIVTANRRVDLERKLFFWPKELIVFTRSLPGVARKQIKFTLARMHSLIRSWLLLEVPGEVSRDERSPMVFRLEIASHPLAVALKCQVFHLAQLKSLLWLAAGGSTAV